MELKDKLKQRRLELGLTLEDVARIVSVSAATISRWESGDIANMRRDKIVMLSQALQVSPSFIMEWNEPSDDNNIDMARNNGERHVLMLARHLEKIPEDKRRRIIENFENTIDLYLGAIEKQEDNDDT